MMSDTSTGSMKEPTSAGSGQRMTRAIIGFALYLFLGPALLFIAAGTLNWPMGWAYVGLLLAAMVLSRVVVWLRNPDTLRERAQFTQAEGTREWDRLLVVIVGLFGPLVISIVAGLDHRFGWPPAISAPVQIAGAVALAVGYGLAVWAMIVNRFFSAVARIQADREQTVVTSGPYRIVRHPSYAGAVVAALALPLMLDAVWAIVPELGMIAAVVARTRLEDRMLLDGLDGYKDYAGQTKHRLVPGIW